MFDFDLLCAETPLPIAIIAGVIVAFVLLILIVLLIIYIVWRRRRKPEEAPVTKAPQRPESLFPEDSKKPVALSKFGEHVDSLAANTNLEYAKEFEVSVLLLHFYFILSRLAVSSHHLSSSYDVFYNNNNNNNNTKLI